jgi:hypothetical protein
LSAACAVSVSSCQQRYVVSAYVFSGLHRFGFFVVSGLRRFGFLVSSAFTVSVRFCFISITLISAALAIVFFVYRGDFL